MRVILALVVTATLWVGPASAAKMLAVFTGEVLTIEGYGSAGPFEGRFLYDTLFGRHIVGTDFESVEGGSVVAGPDCPDGCPGPFREITVSYSGTTTNHTQGFWNSVYTNAGFFSVYPEGGSANIYLWFVSPNIPGSLTTPFTAIGSGGGMLTITGIESTSFSLTDLTVTAVPEPATWAMIIVGFGILGGQLRIARAIKASRLRRCERLPATVP